MSHLSFMVMWVEVAIGSIALALVMTRILHLTSSEFYLLWSGLASIGIGVLQIAAELCRAIRKQ